MNTASMEYEPDENEQAVLDVLREEGRANPYLIRERIDLRKEYVSKALTGLVKAGVVDKVTRGLYEHVPENDDKFDHEDDVEGDIDLGKLRDAVRDAREAYEEVDGDQVDSAIRRLEELLKIEDVE